MCFLISTIRSLDCKTVLLDFTLWCLVPFGASLSIVLLYYMLKIVFTHWHQTWFLLSCIHWIFRGVLSGHDVCWGSPGPGRIGKRGCVATQSPWLTCVPLEGGIEEWTSKVTPTSTCLHPAPCARLLSLSSKRQSSSWMVLSGFPVSAVATLTQWSLGDMRKTRTTDGERCMELHKLHVHSLGWFLQKWLDL